MTNRLRISTVSGPNAAMHEEAIARLRITVFREYPYLYDGDAAYEASYLRTYFRCEEAVCVLVWDGESLVGASTGLPLAAEWEAFQAPFKAAGIPVGDVFYCGESLLLPAYRGRGIGHRFFDEREGWSRRIGPFRHTAFCAVDRPSDDPRQPSDYRRLDPFWIRRGYRRRPDLRASLEWKEVGEAAAVPHRLVFWLRDAS